MASLTDKIQKIPLKTRAIAYGAFIVILLVAYIFQFQIPMNTSAHQLDKSLSDLRTKIRENDEKMKKLGVLKAEVKAQRERLATLTEQLPPESEVSGLLKQIQGLVNQSGLTLKYWKPDARQLHASGLYEEIPISITLSGGYFNAASLFDQIGKLTRIVNIRNIKMGNMKMGKDGIAEITINCKAMTFSAVEKKVEAAATEKKIR
jgi:Tfp pilus assembly protein PilO